jgi:uncharacterized protein
MPNLILSHTLRATLAASLILIAIAGAAGAGSLDDALAAHRRGDYETEYRLVRPLAEQGDASAQAVLGAINLNGYGHRRSSEVVSPRR